MELLKNFGFDPKILIAQIVNFLIIAYVLKRFFYKSILDVLKKREQTIKDGLKQAEDARILLEQTQIKQQAILKKVKEQAQKTISDAKEQANQIAKETAENTKKQVEKMLEDASIQINQDTKEAEKKLAAYVTRIAMDLLSKSSIELFGKKEQKIIMENALKNIKYDQKTN